MLYNKCYVIFGSVPIQVDHSERRAAFVAASWDVIAEEGYCATTLRRVASRARYTTGALTHYFPDRRTLLVAALRAAHGAAFKRMVAVTKGASSDFERLRSVVLEALPLDKRRLREWRVWMAFWSVAVVDGDLAEENAKRYADWLALIEGLLSPLEKSQPGDARLLIALIDGLGLDVARSPRAGGQAKRKQQVCESVIEAYLSHFKP